MRWRDYLWSLQFLVTWNSLGFLCPKRRSSPFTSSPHKLNKKLLCHHLNLPVGDVGHHWPGWLLLAAHPNRDKEAGKRPPYLADHQNPHSETHALTGQRDFQRASISWCQGKHCQGEVTLSYSSKRLKSWYQRRPWCCYHQLIFTWKPLACKVRCNRIYPERFLSSKTYYY